MAAPVGSDFSSEEERLDFSKYAQDDGSLLESLDICVSETEKRTAATSVRMKDTYTAYLVEARVKDPLGRGKVIPGGFSSLWRRYSEFELLKNYLMIQYPQVVVPPVPEKRGTLMWQQLENVDNFDPDFIERRRVGLESFLLRVASHPQLCRDTTFHGFMQEEDGWKEAVQATGFLTKSDSRLKVLNASFRLKKPDRRFEELKNYSAELHASISSLLKTRGKITQKLYGIHKIHGNYGRIFSEWSGLEKDMGDGLQSAGHHMDSYAAGIDSMLEEEEQVADQLKEYMHFADSLKAVCCKQEVMQYHLEKSEESLASKAQQKEDILSPDRAGRGFSLRGVAGKLFGGTPDNPAAKQAKLEQLEQQIEECEKLVRKAQEDSLQFSEDALKDIERFKKQKVKDLQEIFISYAIVQIKIAKKGISVWTNVKESFEKM